MSNNVPANAVSPKGDYLVVQALDDHRNNQPATDMLMGLATMKGRTERAERLFLLYPEERISHCLNFVGVTEDGVPVLTRQAYLVFMEEQLAPLHETGEVSMPSWKGEMYHFRLLKKGEDWIKYMWPK